MCSHMEFKFLLSSHLTTAQSAAPGDIPKDAEFFDSEMFEWTQRPCSPELLSSPLKLQVFISLLSRVLMH